MEDYEIIEYAKQAYASSSGDNIIIQEPGPLAPDEIIDRIDDGTGAWVMAWVYVPIEEEADNAN